MAGTIAHHSALFLSTALFISAWLLTGGGVARTPFAFYLFALTGSWLLAVVVKNDGWVTWMHLPVTAKLAIGFFCLMPLLQCVPLPPAIWHALSGRELAAETLALTGAADHWHPITLNVQATYRTFLMSVWLLALLLAVLRMSSDEVRALFVMLLGLGILHVAIGMLQVASGGRFLFYDVPNINFLLGFFANKNHSGLFIALLFPIGYLALYGDRGWDRTRLPLAAAATLVIFATLILTFSRAGLLFGLVAFVFLLLLVNERRLSRTGRQAALAALAVIALLAIIASTDIATRSLGRFEGVSTDPRWLFWSWSRKLVPIYFPIGSGIGSFEEVFKVVERLSWVKPTYLNHAHNDYMEQLIEVGAAAPVLWMLVVAMVLTPIRNAWRDRARTAGRTALMGAVIVLLILVHSSFDYPLRRPALAVVFITALAVLLRRSQQRKKIA